MHSAAVRKTCSRIIFARKQQNVNVYKLPNICLIECGDKKGMLKPLQRRDSWIRDGGGDQLSNVHPSLLHLVQASSPAATLISHNYLGCAGVANANPGGGATPHPILPPKLWEHFWREVDATASPPTTADH